MPNLRIHYLFVEEDSPLQRHSIFQLLRESELELLRCFMAFLQLPADVERIISGGQPFFEAVLRYRNVPTFRKAPSSEMPLALREDLSAIPLLCLMLGRRVPDWTKTLARDRPVIVLSQVEGTIEESRSVEGMIPGLLRGTEDLRVFYDALRRLCAERTQDERLDDDTRQRLGHFSQFDMFQLRSRLPFIPALPLPQPSRGRPSVYLLNRLSNNVDQPTLQAGDVDDEEWTLPRILTLAVRASVPLALLEIADDLPSELLVTRGELERAHATLTSEADDSAKFRTLMALGERIADKDAFASPFLVVPAARTDVLRGRVPEGIVLEPNHRMLAKSALRALRDFIGNTNTTGPFGNEQEKRDYDRARETLFLEQRFVACESACLASRVGSTPYQLPLRAGDIYGTIQRLNIAIEKNTKKVPILFQSVETSLAALLPEPLLEALASGDSSVQVLSDLPIEWTLIGEWPLCLTRPVARIPLGVTSWDVLSAALEQTSSVNVTTPDRVLVLDLIAEHDKIRHFSDSFASISAALSQHYTYAQPATADAFRETLRRSSAEIVVLDTHGTYDRQRDQVWLGLPDGPVPIDDLLPEERVPPVWILSACDTTVTGAIRGCVVRRLLAKGAICVVATLAPVDAFTAEVFVGRLLTDLYSPITPGAYETFDRLFFTTQYTTALFYDPMLPLMRKAQNDDGLKKAVGRVLGAYFSWAGNRPIKDVRVFRHEVALFLAEALDREGLSELHSGLRLGGYIRPETLLFSVFGVPRHVQLTS
jgi:hypothetical protein